MFGTHYPSLESCKVHSPTSRSNWSPATGWRTPDRVVYTTVRLEKEDEQSTSRLASKHVSFVRLYVAICVRNVI